MYNLILVVLIDSFCESIQYEDFLETSLSMHHEINSYKGIHACVTVTCSPLQEEGLNQFAFAIGIHKLCTSLSVFQILNSSAHHLGCEVLTYLIGSN